MILKKPRSERPRHALKGFRGPVLVTGATGFVGANLCHHLTGKGVSVIGLEGPSVQRWRLKGSPIELVQVDLCDAAAVRTFVRKSQPAAVFHCAAYGAYSSQMDADRIYDVTVGGTRHLLEALREVEDLIAFVQAGSSSEYGANCAAPREDDPTWPDSHYAVAKVAATALVRFYAVKYGMPAWVCRLYSVYGPLEDASRLIPKLLIEAQQGRLPPLVNPKISRDFVYVADVCDAFERFLTASSRLRKGELFNIGTGECVTLRKLVATSRRAFRTKETPNWGSMPDRHWDHARWYANPQKAWRLLGWLPRTSLQEGLEETMRWMNENPELVREAKLNSVTAPPVPLPPARGRGRDP